MSAAAVLLDEAPLPWTASADDSGEAGVVRDATGHAVLVTDPDTELPDEIAGELARAIVAIVNTAGGVPIDLVLFCPACGTQHVDGPAPDKGWTNPSHRSHLCHACGHVWRPADVPTNGVRAVKTRGQADSPIVLDAAMLPPERAR